MSFQVIDPNEIAVGSPIKKELFDKIKNSLDDLDERATSLANTGGDIFVYNGVLHLANFDQLMSDVFYYKTIKAFSLSDFRAQLFSKESVLSGELSLDLQKASNTNNANFNSILTTPLSFNFSTDASFLEKTANIDSTKNSFEVGEVLRLVVLSIPSGFSYRVLLNISGA